MDETRRLNVAVLGAAGTIAPAILRDLAASSEVARMHLLDLDLARTQRAADEHGGDKASAAAVDARDHEQLAHALHGVEVLINTAAYRINLDAMRACLTAGAHYLDLGGLYHTTLRQLELDGEFRERDLIAVLGIGSTPGKTNLMAAHAVAQLGGREAGIDSVEVMASGRDPGSPNDGRLRAPYAIQTLLDELTMKPIVLRDGDPVEIEPLTSGGTVDYGDPVGTAETIYTLHSELATFGGSFGCKQASFRLSLAPPVLAAFKRLLSATPEEAAEIVKHAGTLSNRTVSVHMVRASAGPRRATVRAFTQPHFGLGGSVVSTAAPIVAAVRLLARGQITARGALPPERCINPQQMFAELETRSCTFTTKLEDTSRKASIERI